MSEQLNDSQLTLTAPLLILHDCVLMPEGTHTFLFDGTERLPIFQTATKENGKVFLFCKDDDDLDEYDKNLIGTVCNMTNLSVINNTLSVTLQGLCRARILDFTPKKSKTMVTVLKKEDLPDYSDEMLPLLQELLEAGKANIRNGKALHDFLTKSETPPTCGAIADYLTEQLIIDYQKKLILLDELDPRERGLKFLTYLREEKEISDLRDKITHTVEERMDKNQREYFLRESIRAMQDELKDGGDEDYLQRIRSTKLPEEVAEKLRKEAERLTRIPTGTPDAMVLMNYLDTCLDIPWNKTDREKNDFKAVQETLDRDHDGLEKVKERVVEYIAAKQYCSRLKNQILCLVGPPGTGKTSIANSIATATGRQLVRVSLGGVRDEAEIRGHRKTYVGAMPGRIIRGLSDAKSINPVMVLDEIDKMGQGYQGDPAAALLEVLDSEQNSHFRDHYVELPVDLSEVFFIATANNPENIPKPLLDRMELITLTTYTPREKLSIAKNHLVPKQLKKYGITKTKLKIEDDALREIIAYYTAESGVRTLERTIATLCRKADIKFLEDKNCKLVIGKEDVVSYLGQRKYLPERATGENTVGVVNGLAYTEIGGSVLPVEALSLSGKGEVKFTGSLGDVMKESSQIAVSVVRSLAEEYHLDEEIFAKKDIHIHFPEGAVPKDGPSAGVAIVTSVLSELTGLPVRGDIAMTGEISLRGRVLPIGGLKEKTIAAYNAGVKTVLIPFENQKDLEDIDPEAREHLQFIPAKNIRDVLKVALIKEDNGNEPQ